MNENKKLKNTLREQILRGEITPYVFSNSKGENLFIAYPITTPVEVSTNGLNYEIYPHDNAFYNAQGNSIINGGNLFMYRMVSPVDFRDVYDKTIQELEIKEKTPEDLLREAAKSEHYVAAQVSESNISLYRNALYYAGISNSQIGSYVVVLKDDVMAARAALTVISSMNDIEKDEFVKDPSSFENKYQAELEKLREDEKQFDSVTRDDSRNIVTTPKKIVVKNNHNNYIDTSSLENLPHYEIADATHAGHVENDVKGYADETHDNKIGDIAASTNEKSDLDLSYTKNYDSDTVMPSDAEKNEPINNDAYPVGFNPDEGFTTPSYDDNDEYPGYDDYSEERRLF